MLITYLRELTAVKRSLKADVHLGLFLSFVAGAMNAGGFVVIQQYTAHMSGIATSIANGLMSGHIAFGLAGVAALVCFTLGAACTAVMVNWGRAHQLTSEYALPLCFEAVLLLIFGLLGAVLHQYTGIFVSLAVMLLCFMMGMQNAMITKISRAVIRTTHMTGVITDLGIELGKLVYWNRKIDKEDVVFVRANRAKLALMFNLLMAFFLGAVIGAYGFQEFGFITTVPLAIGVLFLAIMPLIDDILLFFRRL